MVCKCAAVHGRVWERVGRSVAVYGSLCVCSMASVGECGVVCGRVWQSVGG
jgi:hypothetical protein